MKLLTNFTANKICPGSFWSFSCFVGPAKPDMFSYQLLANDVVVDTDSSLGMWVRLLSNSDVFTYKCLANNSVGTIQQSVKMRRTFLLRVIIILHFAANVMLKGLFQGNQV